MVVDKNPFEASELLAYLFQGKVVMVQLQSICGDSALKHAFCHIAFSKSAMWLRPNFSQPKFALTFDIQ